MLFHVFKKYNNASKLVHIRKLIWKLDRYYGSGPILEDSRLANNQSAHAILARVARRPVPYNKYEVNISWVYFSNLFYRFWWTFTHIILLLICPLKTNACIDIILWCISPPKIHNWGFMVWSNKFLFCCFLRSPLRSRSILLLFPRFLQLMGLSQTTIIYWK